MKIVHLESGRHLYGGARQVRYLLDALAVRGVDNVLLCRPGHPLAAGVRRVAVREVPLHGDLDIGMIRRLRRVFAELDPDVVHVHSRRGADLFGGLACALDGRAAILTRRVDSPEPALWARYRYRPYRRLVAISRAVEAQLRARLGGGGPRVTRIASAVDDSLFGPDGGARERMLRTFAFPDGALIAVVCAQLIPRKGHAWLLACLPGVVARHPQLRVVCFGQGRLRPRLEQRATDLGLDGILRFAGYRDDWPALLPGADVLVHPAEREGLGVAVLEAMSCAVPVLATRVGGIPDAVTDGIEGRLVAPGDGPSLGAALSQLIDDASTRRRFGAAGRIRVQTEFSIAQMADRYLNVYRDVC